MKYLMIYLAGALTAAAILVAVNRRAVRRADMAAYYWGMTDTLSWIEARGFAPDEWNDGAEMYAQHRAAPRDFPY